MMFACRLINKAKSLLWLRRWLAEPLQDGEIFRLCFHRSSVCHFNEPSQFEMSMMEVNLKLKIPWRYFAKRERNLERLQRVCLFFLISDSLVWLLAAVAIFLFLAMMNEFAASSSEFGYQGDFTSFPVSSFSLSSSSSKQFIHASDIN